MGVQAFRDKEMTTTELTNLGLQPGLKSTLSDADTLAFFERHEIELEERLEQMNFRWNSDGIEAVEARLAWVRREIDRLTPTITLGDKVRQVAINLFGGAIIAAVVWVALVGIFAIDALVGGAK